LPLDQTNYFVALVLARLPGLGGPPVLAQLRSIAWAFNYNFHDCAGRKSDALTRLKIELGGLREAERALPYTLLGAGHFKRPIPSVDTVVL